MFFLFCIGKCSSKKMSDFIYITRQELIGHISQAQLDEALQDTKNAKLSADDVWEQLHASIANDIHWRIEPRVKVPFYSNVPAIVKRAALVFACEAIFQRRKIAPKDNPFTPPADEMRKRLDAIGSGSAPLGSSVEETYNDGAIVISEPAKTKSSWGRLST